MTVEFGLVMPAGPQKQRIAEWMTTLDTVIPQFAGHFNGLWMTDHFFWDDEPTYEAWTVLAYMAARYPTWHFGPIVLGQSYRNPALLAKMAATLQTLSNGRFIMGIGAGWKEDEYHAYGYPYPVPGVRVGQLEDTLEIFRLMWTQPGKASYQGKYYHIKDAWCEPKPDPKIPVLVGGGGYKTMQLAVKYADWWNLPDASYKKYADRVTILRRHCETAGRDPKSLRLSWFGRLAVAQTEAEAIAYSNGKWTKEKAFVGTVTQVLDLMRPFVDLGVDYFIVEVLGLPNPDVVGMIREQILPALQR